MEYEIYNFLLGIFNFTHSNTIIVINVFFGCNFELLTLETLFSNLTSWFVFLALSCFFCFLFYYNENYICIKICVCLVWFHLNIHGHASNIASLFIWSTQIIAFSTDTLWCSWKNEFGTKHTSYSLCYCDYYFYVFIIYKITILSTCSGSHNCCTL